MTVAFVVHPASAQAFTVSISSPSSGAILNRGESVTVTASVTSSESAVSGATVAASSPTGGTISLPETAIAGTYSAQYTILGTDPTAAWMINVQAVKNGQLGSSSTSVSISGALKVSISSPASAAKFNIGEIATLKASVTYQDGARVPGATVSFNKPVSGSVTMAVDSSDPTGKTWTGSYAIQASDVSADGIAWPITVTAIGTGNSGSSVQNVNLYKSLIFTVSTFSSTTFSVPDNSFNRGETVFVKALVSLLDGKPVTSGTASFEISGTSIAAIPTGMTFNPSIQAWTGSYTLLGSDQTGAQTVTVTGSDSQGNTGSGVHQIKIASEEGFSVSITSPVPNSIFNRGETVTISASVTLIGIPLTGATVTANNPTGGTITLTDSGGGVYSAHYTVLSTDPTGTWKIVVTATQGANSGSSQVATMISSSLKVSVTTPTPGAKFNIGQTTTIKATVTYQDGSAVANTASVSFEKPISGSVSMALDPSDSSGKTWKGTYTIVSTDVPVDGATWGIVASASVGGNSGSSSPANVRLFSSLEVVVSTWSSSSFTTPKDSFIKGDTVFIKAVVTLRNGTVVSAGTVGAKISGTSISSSAQGMTFSNSLNAWTTSYILLQTDQTGNQLVTVTAADANANTGSGTHGIGVEVPSTGQQALEASITFDPKTQDIVVNAVCNAGCVSPTTVTVSTETVSTSDGHQHNNDKEGHGGEDDNGTGGLRNYTITDSAGHALKLQIQVQSQDNKLKARLLSLQYGNSAPITPSDNKITFKLSAVESGDVKSLKQSIDVQDIVQAKAIFDANNNHTTIRIETDNSDDDNGGTKVTNSGLWLLELVTTNGALSVSYFQPS